MAKVMFRQMQLEGLNSKTPTLYSKLEEMGLRFGQADADHGSHDLLALSSSRLLSRPEGEEGRDSVPARDPREIWTAAAT
jgi:hypothetical protein